MTTILLIIIYFAFISLGLPDSMLGSAWPIMQGELGLPLSGAGLISMTISGGTILSSFLSGRLLRRFGTGKLTLVSVFLTAVALFGFSMTKNFGLLCLMAVPLGLGAGAVDSALNNFVALHYAAKHMNWLHCFWGVGATAGPLIMSLMLLKTNSWQNGYQAVSIVQFVLVIVLFLSLPLWKSHQESIKEEKKTDLPPSQKLWTIEGLKITLLGFFCYCALEASAGLWGATYLVQEKGIPKETAAGWISIYFLGITLGRFINGFLSTRWNSKTLIRLGLGLIVVGIVLLFISPGGLLNLLGFICMGMGCAPIFPSMLHETPNRFGKENSSRLMGIQMAFAYIGTTFVPPIVGVVSAAVGMRYYPIFLLLLVGVMALGSETVNSIGKRKSYA